jgi:dihydrofolate reductase
MILNPFKIWTLFHLELKMIYAHKSRLIGVNGEIPWKIPEDTRLFRNITEGHIVICGGTTFSSISKRPLEGRDCIVISKRLYENPETVVLNNENFDHNERKFIVVNSVANALLEANKLQARSGYTKDIIVIGGKEIYEQTIDFTGTIYETLICSNSDNDEVEGGTYLPPGFTQDFTVMADSTITDGVFFFTKVRNIRSLYENICKIFYIIKDLK